MGQTIAEKIFSNKVGSKVYAEDLVSAPVDFIVSHDGLGPMAVDAFQYMKGDKVANPDKVCFVFDHFVPSPVKNYSLMQEKVKKFCLKNNIKLYDSGEGICHQVVPEKGYVVPGDLVIGTDSHTCTYGAINAFATGVGSTDAAACMKTGQLWFKVPKTIKTVFRNTLSEGVYSKDLVLFLIGKIGADGANYKSVEFHGDAIKSLEVEDRFTISNMSIEMGAKAGLMVADEKTKKWLDKRAKREYQGIAPDGDAAYDNIYEFDANDIEPQIALPHQVDNVASVADIKKTNISLAIIGTCTNGRISDLKIAADILKNKKVASGVRLVIVPASRSILLDAINQGIMQTLIEAGGMLITPGCGPCVGTHAGIPSDGENVITSANRNFKGRCGNGDAFAYLASPATVAASALTGFVTDPRSI